MLLSATYGFVVVGKVFDTLSLSFLYDGCWSQ